MNEPQVSSDVLILGFVPRFIRFANIHVDIDRTTSYVRENRFDAAKRLIQNAKQHDVLRMMMFLRERGLSEDSICAAYVAAGKEPMLQEFLDEYLAPPPSPSAALSAPTMTNGTAAPHGSLSSSFIEDSDTVFAWLHGTRYYQATVLKIDPSRYEDYYQVAFKGPCPVGAPLDAWQEPRWLVLGFKGVIVDLIPQLRYLRVGTAVIVSHGGFDACAAVAGAEHPPHEHEGERSQGTGPEGPAAGEDGVDTPKEGLSLHVSKLAAEDGTITSLCATHEGAPASVFDVLLHSTGETLHSVDAADIRVLFDPRANLDVKDDGADVEVHYGVGITPYGLIQSALEHVLPGETERPYSLEELEDMNTKPLENSNAVPPINKSSGNLASLANLMRDTSGMITSDLDDDLIVADGLTDGERFGFTSCVTSLRRYTCFRAAIEHGYTSRLQTFQELCSQYGVPVDRAASDLFKTLTFSLPMGFAAVGVSGGLGFGFDASRAVAPNHPGDSLRVVVKVSDPKTALSRKVKHLLDDAMDALTVGIRLSTISSFMSRGGGGDDTDFARFVLAQEAAWGHSTASTLMTVNPILALSEQALQSHHAFTDPGFSPSMEAIIGPIACVAVAARAVTIPKLFGDLHCPKGSVLHWRRLSELSPNLSMRLATTKPLHLQPGPLTPVWLPAVLSILSTTTEFESIISPADRPSPFHVYTVRLTIDGTPHFVVVDDFVPVMLVPSGTDAGSQRIIPLGIRSLTPSEIWPCIIEKALAKMEGSYAAMCGVQSSLHPYLLASARPHFGPQRVLEDLCNAMVMETNLDHVVSHSAGFHDQALIDSVKVGPVERVSYVSRTHSVINKAFRTVGTEVPSESDTCWQSQKLLAESIVSRLEFPKTLLLFHGIQRNVAIHFDQQRSLIQETGLSAERDLITSCSIVCEAVHKAGSSPLTGCFLSTFIVPQPKIEDAEKSAISTKMRSLPRGNATSAARGPRSSAKRSQKSVSDQVFPSGHPEWNSILATLRVNQQMLTIYTFSGFHRIAAPLKFDGSHAKLDHTAVSVDAAMLSQLNPTFAGSHSQSDTTFCVSWFSLYVTQSSSLGIQVKPLDSRLWSSEVIPDSGFLYFRLYEYRGGGHSSGLGHSHENRHELVASSLENMAARSSRTFPRVAACTELRSGLYVLAVCLAGTAPKWASSKMILTVWGEQSFTLRPIVLHS